MKAEIIQRIDIIDSNFVFRLLMQTMTREVFPDSTTANSYQQKMDKVKYTIQFGIAPYLKDIFYELKELPFLF